MYNIFSSLSQFRHFCQPYYTERSIMQLGRLNIQTFNNSQRASPSPPHIHLIPERGKNKFAIFKFQINYIFRIIGCPLVYLSCIIRDSVNLCVSVCVFVCLFAYLFVCLSVLVFRILCSLQRGKVRLGEGAYPRFMGWASGNASL